MDTVEYTKWSGERDMVERGEEKNANFTTGVAETMRNNGGKRTGNQGRRESAIRKGPE